MKRGPLTDLGNWWRSLSLLLLVGAAPARASGPPPGEGVPLAQHFSPRDYHGGTQCLCATQDQRGVMYIGSLGLAMEYDGSTWRKIDVDSNYVAGLAYDAGTDTVFVGAENNLGILRKLPGGERTFVSLLGQLPADARDVGVVEEVFVTPEGVFFVSSNQVMRWRDGRFKVWKFSTVDRLRSEWTGGRLYVHSLEVGLLRLENEAFAPVSDDPLFRRLAVRAILAGADGTLLVGTLHDGLCTLRDGVVRPAESDCDAFLKAKGIYKLLRLRDGSLAVATDTAGVVFLDAAGRFRSCLDQAGGLHGNRIFGLFEDAEEGLWVGLQSGITRAEIHSPLSILRAGPDDDLSSAYNANPWFDTLVLGAAAGLFRVVPADPAKGVSAHLERLPGSLPATKSNCTVENGLLTITDGKIALLDAGARLVPVASEISHACDMLLSRAHPGRVYVVDEGGRIGALRLDAETHLWVIDRTVADLGVSGGQFDLVESAPGDLWVTSQAHGLFRVQLVSGGPAVVTSFLDRTGPLRGQRYVDYCSRTEPIRFKGAHEICGLDPSGRELRVLTEFGARFCDGSYYFGEAMSYEANSLWLTATDVHDPTGESLRGQAVVGRAGGAPSFRALPHKVEEAIGKPGVFHPVDVPPDPLKTLLLVGTTGNGVVRMDVAQWDAQPAARPFATLIRRAFTVHRAATAAGTLPILGDALPYARNSAHFEFAAATLAYGAAPRFQTRLVNFGAGEWSDFGDRASVDYLNLPEGSYTFEVRARNSDGQLGSVAAQSFRVLPPWQRSPWAYAAYALAAALGLFALVRWRGWQLEQRNAALGALVDARTGELRSRESDLLANERSLMRARDDAERANRAKSAFLANMSHELRTPLNAILGYAQILLKQPNLPARSREQIAVIGQSGGHLLSLINEVLDLSKVEAGKLTLSRLDFSLRQLLDEVGAVFRPRFAEKGLAFTETRAPDLPPVVHSDPSRLRQVLFNLLSNAVKFTQRGSVSLEVRTAGTGVVRFEVTDTGVGIAEADLRDIFLAFHQAGESSLAAQGTGLGLAISQRLVELLGGRIEVASTPGGGSRFWFELPLPAVETGEGLLRDFHEQAQGRVTGYEGAARRLLLVDDVPENRRVLRDFLQPLGFEVEEAVDGTDALAACARRLPDAVLLDLRLGAVDGFEVARTLRARTHGTPLGIIAISASVFESDRQHAIDAGCDDFLPKPFEETLLLGTLGRVLGLRWVQAGAEAVSPANGAPSPDGDEGAPLREEIQALLELSLRGDIVGIRKRLDTLRAAGVADGTATLVRRLEPLVASYQMDDIHAMLLEAQTHHAGN